MRFAFSTAPQNCTWQEVLDIWRAADDIDLFESGWTFDHFEPIFSDRTGPCLEGWTTLTALLQATTRLRGGVMVTGMVYRHPAVLANMAATVDIVSGGRLELGLGAGWNTDECDAYGIELGSLKERFDRFSEGLEVIVWLLRDEVSSFDGRWFHLDEARCEPKPVQRPHPPICIGGGGEKRTLPLVAKYAQIWNYPGNSTDPVRDFRAKREVLERACAEIGRDPAEITMSTQLWGREQSPSQMADRAAEYAEAGVGLCVVSLPRPLRAADLEPIATALAPLR
jgi:F420-dependent oxidoreductase-like protein